MEMLERHKPEIPEIVFRRCRYVITEKDRLLHGCDALQRHDLETFGELMYTTHQGLSKDYEVSCPELDFLAETAKPMQEVSGTRMMGGGFGGCTINIVDDKKVDAFKEKIQKAYKDRFGKTPDVYITQIEDGVNII